MIDFFNSCLDFFSMIGRFFVGLYESISNSITAVTSGWDYLNNKEQEVGITDPLIIIFE